MAHAREIAQAGFKGLKTNPFRFDGDRVCIVVNFNVITNTYAELHRPMRF